MNGFRLWQETDRLCSKCRLYLAEPMDWLCQKCRQELEDKWNEVIKKIHPTKPPIYDFTNSEYK